MQYTIRGVPPSLDTALRQRAREEQKSLNQVVLEGLAKSFGLPDQPIKHRDMGDVAGTWKEDAQIEQALADQRRIDSDLWQ